MKKGRLTCVVVAGVMMVLLAGCGRRPHSDGQQYLDGELTQPLVQVGHLNSASSPINCNDFSHQVQEIQHTAAALYVRHASTFDGVQRWLKAGGDTRRLKQFGLHAYQMKGKDSFGNVQFTGYYTTIIQARHTRQGEFQYPIYRMPSSMRTGRLPSRAAIYQGTLSDNDVIAWSNSLIDNFILDVQGSGYVDFGDGLPPKLLSYAGKNGWPYHSIGKELIDRGDIPRDAISMQTIRQWASSHSPADVQSLLETNPSFVFFKTSDATSKVRGASAVPLVARTAAAADRRFIPPGTVLLAEIPVLTQQGKFSGQYEMRLLVALDVGGAIKGQHLDLYQGSGAMAAQLAGYYNHYGRVWLLHVSPLTRSLPEETAQHHAPVPTTHV